MNKHFRHRGTPYWYWACKIGKGYRGFYGPVTSSCPTAYSTLGLAEFRGGVLFSSELFKTRKEAYAYCKEQIEIYCEKEKSKWMGRKDLGKNSNLSTMF